MELSAIDPSVCNRTLSLSCLVLDLPDSHTLLQWPLFLEVTNQLHAWSLPQPRKWVCLCWLASPYSPVPTVLLLLHIIMSNRNWYSRPSLTYRTTHNTRYWGTLHSSLAAACILRINNAIPHSLRLLRLAIYNSFHTSFTCRFQYSSCYQFLIEVGLVAPLEIEINTHPSLIDN